MGRVVVALVLLLAAGGGMPRAQSDLDALMAKVLARRDDNWKKLQQYILNERESLQVTGPGSLPVYGFRREYLWYPRDGRFVRSPLTADGVQVADEERTRYENRWIERDERRATREGLEPGFISAAYFLNFTFEPGRYALVGRETVDGQDTLRIEYYPTQMFTGGRARPNRRIRERDADAERKMNKVSLVTLWVLPDDHQILKYEVENIDLDFLPAQPLLRFEGGTATMEMGQPFDGVWLPRTLVIRFEMTLATGEVQGRYSSEYDDYRLASVTTRVR